MRSASEKAPNPQRERSAQLVVALAGGGVLLAVYVATLAPDVTFWDAGEFIAAARVLGIPHPPGTPLFIVLLNAWARLWWFLPFAIATNLFSAACTAGAGALSAAFMLRATGDRWMAVAAAIAAGTMTSVWQNATETEVYAASLALAVVALVSADFAGRTGSTRWTLLSAYVLALGVPLHLSVLVASPAVVFLAARRQDGTTDWATGMSLAGVSLVAIGAGTVAPGVAAVGVVLVVASATIGARAPIRPPTRRIWSRAAAFIAISLVALSALMFLLVRARHDPAINQANPSSLHELAYVVARRQYDVAPLWPRQAPVWIQLANWFEYADWQFALSLAPSPVPNLARVSATLVFAALGIVGCLEHRRADHRTWIGLCILFAAGSLGVIGYLNLKAGSSFGWGVLPDTAPHEARDRDYFFVLGFWTWGLWAGTGAVALARRWTLQAFAGVIVAALPIVLNWREMDRRAQPEAGTPRTLAEALLEPLPPNAVLFVAGDNDSYPLWYAQQVLGVRRDVTTVTTPLLGAAWYSDELARRHRLLGPVAGGGELTLRIADALRTQHRALAVALTVPSASRDSLGRRWIIRGLVALSADAAGRRARDTTKAILTVDTVATRDWARWIATRQQGRRAHPSVDPVYTYFSDVLACPEMILDRSLARGRAVSLDSLCNFR